jgi:hypothetical protein
MQIQARIASVAGMIALATIFTSSPAFVAHRDRAQNILNGLK